MTQEQLELLLQYIDLRMKRAAPYPEGISLGYSDEEADIRYDLRKTIEDVVEYGK